MIAYSVTITKFDPSVKANRESTVWIHRARATSDASIQRIVNRCYPGSNVQRIKFWAVQK